MIYYFAGFESFDIRLSQNQKVVLGVGGGKQKKMKISNIFQK